MDLDFDDKVALAAHVINKLFDEDRIGEIFEETMNDHGYDTETIQDDLQDTEQCSAIDAMQEEATHIEWDQTKEQLLHKALSDIFIKQITDYDQLIAGLLPQQVEDDDDSKKIPPVMKQLADLNHMEIANVIEYIIDDMHKKGDNDSRALYSHKANIINSVLLQQWNGSFDFEKDHQFEQKICKLLHNIIAQNALKKLRKEIYAFDMRIFERIEMKQYEMKPVQLPLDDLKQEQESKVMHNEPAPVMNNKQFLAAVQKAIQLTNDEMNPEFQPIDSQRVMRYFTKHISLTTLKSFTARSFSDEMRQQNLMARGCSAKFYRKLLKMTPDRTLIELNDEEFYYIVHEGCSSINKEERTFSVIDGHDLVQHMKNIGLNGKKFIASFSKKEFQKMVAQKMKKGPANTLYKYLRCCEVEKLLRIKRTKELPQLPPIQQQKYSDLSDLQIRYAVQYQLLSFNAKFADNKRKQIANTDGVIRYLCDRNNDGTTRLDKDKLRSVRLDEFVYALYDNMGVKHNPGKKLLRGVRAYDYHAIGQHTELDLNLPFIFKQCIRALDEKQHKYEDSVLLSIQYAKYSDVEDRRKLVALFDKHKCKLSKGATFKLVKNVIQYVESGQWQKKLRYHDDEKKEIVREIKKEQTQKPMVEIKQHKIFEILNKYKNIAECETCAEFKEIVQCCVELIDVDDAVLIIKALDDKLKRKQVEIHSLSDCDHDSLVNVMEQCCNELSDANREKVLIYIKKSKMNGRDIQKTFTKKSKFAIHCHNEAGFTKKDKGIKTKLMKVYTKMNDFDFSTLSPSNREVEHKDNEEMNGMLFMKHFESALLFVEYMMTQNISNITKQQYDDLYQSIYSFFKRIQHRNDKEFSNLLHLFINKKYGINVMLKDIRLNGAEFVNGNDTTYGVFSERLRRESNDKINGQHALCVYDDLMELHLRSKGIRTLEECATRNEAIYMVRKHVIPQFNDKHAKHPLNNKDIVAYLQSNPDIDIAAYFSKDNRKCVANQLKKQFSTDIKMGPIRKLCWNIDSYSVT